MGWPGYNALTSSIVSGRLRTQFFGINFALVNLGIGIGGIISGFLTDVDRPGTFTAIFLADAACVLVPITLLLGPLRHVAGRPGAHLRRGTPDAGPATSPSCASPPSCGSPLLTFLTSFVGYGQMEAGFPAFARQVSEVSTRTIGLAFAANTAVIVGLQFLVLRVIDGHRRTRVFLGLVVMWAAAWLLLGATGLVAGTLLAAVGRRRLPRDVRARRDDAAADRARPSSTTSRAIVTAGRFNAVSAGAFQIGRRRGPRRRGLDARPAARRRLHRRASRLPRRGRGPGPGAGAADQPAGQRPVRRPSA